MGTCRQALGHARRCRGSPLRERIQSENSDVPLRYHGQLRFPNPKSCCARRPPSVSGLAAVCGT